MNSKQDRPGQSGQNQGNQAQDAGKQSQGSQAQDMRKPDERSSQGQGAQRGMADDGALEEENDLGGRSSGNASQDRQDERSGMADDEDADTRSRDSGSSGSGSSVRGGSPNQGGPGERQR